LFKDLKKIFNLLSPYKLKIVLAFISMMMVALFTMLVSVIVQPIMDILFMKDKASLDKTGSLWIKNFLNNFLANLSVNDIAEILPFIVAGIFLGKAIFFFLSRYQMKSIGFNVVKNLRDKLYLHLLTQSIRFFSRSKTGVVISNITNDIDKVQNSVTTTVAELLVESLTLVGLLFWVFYQDWHLALITFIIIPLAIIPVKFFAYFAKKEGHRIQSLVGDISSFLYELVHGIRIIKTYNMEKFEKKKFLKTSKNYLKAALRMALVTSASSPFMEFIGGILAAVILAIGTHKIHSGQITPGQFISFFTALSLMYPSIQKLSHANTALQQGIAGYERVERILEQRNELESVSGTKKLEDIKGKIEYKNISFRYDEGNGYVLKDINFKIDKGEKIALVGLSGSGKTTLVNLVPRFFDPSEGKVLIDNTDIKELDLVSLRNNIGMVTQDIVIFNDTVRGNITCGEDIPEEKVIEAAKLARAHSFITKLPKNYDTNVGERGQFISQGEKQRLSIARVFLKNPPIIILDEATSSLDSQSESIIQKALKNLMKERTTLIVAHRLSTVINADKILVLSKGQIAEKGSHKELIKKNGLYAHLYNLQFVEKV